MEFETINLKKTEQKYTYQQSQQIKMQTGLIGYLRADMDSDGKGFFSDWYDFRDDLKTLEFKSEFDRVINSLRGDFLKDRTALSQYCNTHPESSFGKDDLGNTREYGVRVNTDNYAYLQGLELNRGIYDENKNLTDIIAGKAFICDCSGEDFGSLSDEQQKKYMNQFKRPEKFFKIGNDIHGVKFNPMEHEKER